MPSDTLKSRKKSKVTIEKAMQVSSKLITNLLHDTKI